MIGRAFVTKAPASILTCCSRRLFHPANPQKDALLTTTGSAVAATLVKTGEATGVPIHSRNRTAWGYQVAVVPRAGPVAAYFTASPTHSVPLAGLVFVRQASSTLISNSIREGLYRPHCTATPLLTLRV